MTGGWWTPLDIPIRIGRDEAHRRAADELAKSKYGGLPHWLDRFLGWLQGLVERLVEAFARMLVPGSGGGLNPGFVVFAVILVLAIAFLVWRVGLPRWRRRRRDAAVELDRTARADDYREAAERAAHAENWHDAVRDRFRAVVRELEIRTILDVRPARTAWEAAASAGRVLPACQAALDTGAEAFSAVVYGDRPADGSLYRQLVVIDDEITAAADRADLAADDVLVAS